MSLEIGSRGTLQIRSETISGTGLPPFSILFASDLHFSAWTKHLVEQVVGAAEQCQPDLILLGGDLADTRSGLSQLAECTLRLAAIAPVWAISGNHDALLGIEHGRQCVEKSGGYWLDNRSYSPVRGLSVDSCGCLAQERRGDFSILCAHDPCVFPQAVAARYDLVLAGHLHGGQVVLRRHGEILYPGAWFYRWNGNSFRDGATTMLVSRGANDTLPLRWNCPRGAAMPTWASMNYIFHNAVHHGYVARWQDWPYSNAVEYLAEVGREVAERRWQTYPICDYSKDWDPPEM